MEEWEPIPFGTALSRQEAEQLEDKAATAGATHLFRWTRTSVAVQNWLGVVRVETVEMVIVPKGWGNLAADGRAAAQETLVMLFAEATGISLYPTGLARVSPQPLLRDYLFELYLETLRLALRRRVSRTYTTVAEVGNRPRGSIQFPGQFLVQFMRPGSFATRYTVLTADNALNRVLLTAVRAIEREGHEVFRAKAASLAGALRGVAQPPRPQDRSNARAGQLDELQRTCLDLAELILDSGGGEGFFVGTTQLGAQLVRSDRLWERGISAQLLRLCGPTAIRLQPQNEFALARVAPSRGRALELIPDVLRTDVAEALDTKWKLLDRSKPNLGVEPEDLEQALAYAAHFRLRRVALLYPGFDAVKTESAARFTRVHGPDVTIDAVLVPLAGPPAAFRDNLRAVLTSAERGAI